MQWPLQYWVGWYPINNVLINNVGMGGGAVHVYGGNIEFSKNLIIANSANGSLGGGGIYVYSETKIVARNNVFFKNTVSLVG
jgi:hypothetical protein